MSILQNLKEIFFCRSEKSGRYNKNGFCYCFSAKTKCYNYFKIENFWKILDFLDIYWALEHLWHAVPKPIFSSNISNHFSPTFYDRFIFEFLKSGLEHLCFGVPTSSEIENSSYIPSTIV
jgi:hypothetical protein